MATRYRTDLLTALVARCVAIDLSHLPEHCERLVLVASGADSTVNVARTALLILDPAAETSRLTFRPFDTTVMPALVCAEIYRRQGSWRLRAVDQGQGDGLAGLAATTTST